jgi:hypothetical protein
MIKNLSDRIICSPAQQQRQRGRENARLAARRHRAAGRDRGTNRDNFPEATAAAREERTLTALAASLTLILFSGSATAILWALSLLL